MDEDGKVYRGTFGTIGGQVALTRLMEESGFFDVTTSQESIDARNFVMHILHKMEVFKYEEDRREFVAQMLRRAAERVVDVPQETQNSRGRRKR